MNIYTHMLLVFLPVSFCLQLTGSQPTTVTAGSPSSAAVAAVTQAALNAKAAADGKTEQPASAKKNLDNKNQDLSSSSSSASSAAGSTLPATNEDFHPSAPGGPSSSSSAAAKADNVKVGAVSSKESVPKSGRISPTTQLIERLGSWFNDPKKRDIVRMHVQYDGHFDELADSLNAYELMTPYITNLAECGSLKLIRSDSLQALDLDPNSSKLDDEKNTQLRAGSLLVELIRFSQFSPSLRPSLNDKGYVLIGWYGLVCILRQKSFTYLLDKEAAIAHADMIQTNQPDALALFGKFCNEYYEHIFEKTHIMCSPNTRIPNFPQLCLNKIKELKIQMP